ncbi:MAG TPA: hypothetical protein VFR08_06155 [Candidatus Angelobacter sp.]|nr:hypothetical protein [Candidatus Angelobacter sp.]
MNATDFFTALEQEFNGAVARKDADSLDSRFLGPDFGLHISLQPDQSVPRKDWLATLRVYNVRRWSMRACHVRDFGNLAIINLIINQEVMSRALTAPETSFLLMCGREMLPPATIGTLCSGASSRAILPRYAMLGQSPR